MSWFFKLFGNTGNIAEVNAAGELEVAMADGKARLFSENDPGTILGSPSLLSPETDDDYRLRVSQDLIFDSEAFGTAAQNTGKHALVQATMTTSFTASGLLTNNGNSLTNGAGLTFGTYACFPVLGSTEFCCEFEGGFTAQPTTNTLIDVGTFIRNAANPHTPVDGIFFRLDSAGMSGVISHNGVETNVSLPFTYANNRVYQFLIVAHPRKAEFWIDDVLYGTIECPIAQGQLFVSSSLPFSLRHAIVGGTAGAAISFNLRQYAVSVGGSGISTVPSTSGNRIYGSYQGLSGGSMGSLASYANSANPTAGVPSNTSAVIGSGLGGQFWETDTLAAGTDGIICSYQVPPVTATFPSRRLVVRGIKISSYVQAALTGGGYNEQWSLAFGHTAVSLATTESVNGKSPRRIPLDVRSVAAGAAVLTKLETLWTDFGDAPIFVNPGEFIAVVKKKVGTAPSAGTMAHVITFIYGWE